MYSPLKEDSLTTRSITMRIVILILISAATWRAAGDEQTNPFTIGVDVNYLDAQGISRIQVIGCVNCAWNPLISPYETEGEVHTTEAGTAFAHVDINFDFPLPIGQKPNQFMITAEQVKAFFDQDLGDDYTAVSAATMKYNCHGYTLGNNIWTEVIAGVQVFMVEEYEDASLTQGGRYAFEEGSILTVDHSYKVISTCVAPECSGVRFITKRREKWNVSPIYEISYDCSDVIDVEEDFRLMKKKPEE